MGYPRQIDHFKDHRDFIEDVEAGDVNKIQDAIAAIETTIGTMPTRFVNKQRDTKNSGDPNFDQADRDVRRNVVNYRNIADRLDALERGGTGGNGGNGGLPWFHYNVSFFNFPPTGAAIDIRPPLVPVDPPDPLKDRYQMYNGEGATLKRDGFWIFHASMVVQMHGSQNADNWGLYNLVIDNNGIYVPSAGRTEHLLGTAGVVFVQTHNTGVFSAGTRITLRASHNADTTQVIQKAVLTGCMLRDISIEE